MRYPAQPVNPFFANGGALQGAAQPQPVAMQPQPQSVPMAPQGQQLAYAPEYQVQTGYQPQSLAEQELLNLRSELDRLHNTYSRQLMEQGQALQELQQSLKHGLVQFPDQILHSGPILYPDRYPFPMDLSVELTTTDSRSYGITNEIVREAIKIDVDNPTFLTRIGFELFKKDVQGNTGIVGAFLPLSATQWSGILTTADAAGPFTHVYQGRDFRWQILTSSDDRIWQSGYRTSDAANGDHREGWRLPLEYELRRNDSLVIEAQPIGPVPSPAQEWSLVVHLYIYKMLQRREREG